MKADVIIAALNEEQTIKHIVEVARNHPNVERIIVVSDGSEDNTAKKAKAGGADIVIELDQTQGKAHAVMQGFKKTTANVIALLDADLLNFTHEQLEQILLPVLENHSDMNIALRDRGIPWRWFQPYVVKISGQLALKRELLEQFKADYLEGYMFETALNYHARFEKARITYVFLADLSARLKLEKQGFVVGLANHILMIFIILKAHYMLFPKYAMKNLRTFSLK